MDVQVREHPNGKFFWTQFGDGGEFISQSGASFLTAEDAVAGARGDLPEPTNWDVEETPLQGEVV